MRKNYQYGMSLIEYVVIIGVVSTALIVMNTYVKRGIQGKIKDLTDHIISNEQEADINKNPSASFSASTTNDTTDSNMSVGGGLRIASRGVKLTVGNSTYEDTTRSVSNSGFTTAEAGMIRAINTSEARNGTYANSTTQNTTAATTTQVSEAQLTDILNDKKTELLNEAAALESNATTMENSANESFATVRNTDCDDEDECETAMQKLYAEATRQVANASAMRTNATTLRNTAANLTIADVQADIAANNVTITNLTTQHGLDGLGGYNITAGGINGP